MTNEQAILEILHDGLSGLPNVTVVIEDVDKYQADIKYGSHWLRCRWYEEGGYFQVWHRLEVPVNDPELQTQETLTAYRLYSPEQARSFSNWYINGLRFSYYSRVNQMSLDISS